MSFEQSYQALRCRPYATFTQCWHMYLKLLLMLSAEAGVVLGVILLVWLISVTLGSPGCQLLQAQQLQLG